MQVITPQAFPRHDSPHMDHPAGIGDQPCRFVLALES
jgi:hypothetical protein